MAINGNSILTYKEGENIHTIFDTEWTVDP